jgi:hypothetical protein
MLEHLCLVFVMKRMQYAVEISMCLFHKRSCVRNRQRKPSNGFDYILGLTLYQSSRGGNVSVALREGQAYCIFNFRKSKLDSVMLFSSCTSKSCRNNVGARYKRDFAPPNFAR